MGTPASGFDKFVTIFSKLKEQENKQKFELLKLQLKEQYEAKKEEKKRQQDLADKKTAAQEADYLKDPAQATFKRMFMDENPLTGLGQQASNVQITPDTDPMNPGGFITSQPIGDATQVLPVGKGQYQQVPIREMTGTPGNQTPIQGAINLPFMNSMKDRIEKAQKGEGQMPPMGAIRLYQKMTEKLAKLQDKPEKRSAPLTVSKLMDLGRTAAKSKLKHSWDEPTREQIISEAKLIARDFGIEDVFADYEGELVEDKTSDINTRVAKILTDNGYNADDNSIATFLKKNPDFK